MLIGYSFKEITAIGLWVLLKKNQAGTVDSKIHENPCKQNNVNLSRYWVPYTGIYHLLQYNIHCNYLFL